MFETTPTSPVDPIFQVMAACKADPRPDKVDLGIGVIRNEHGQTPVMAAVTEAERLLHTQQHSKAYLGPAGRTEYCQQLAHLLLPEHSTSGQLATIQTPGGTGALRVAADLLNHTRPGTRLWLSDPPWVTHRAIFPAAGLQLQDYRYQHPEHSGLDFVAMLADLSQLQPGDIVLLQVAGHNPTGCDLSPQQWHQLAALMAERNALPLLDLAYHGLAQSLSTDSEPLGIIAQYHSEWLLCYSCSKSFGLYNERTGALLIHTATPTLTHRVHQEAINQICANYYMPPDHGAAIVATILASTELSQCWQQELDHNRQRLQQQRQQLVQALRLRLPAHWSQLASQQGLFSYLDLSNTQLAHLAQQHGVYLGAGGRINISGLNAGNQNKVIEAISGVVGIQDGQTE